MKHNLNQKSVEKSVSLTINRSGVDRQFLVEETSRKLCRCCMQTMLDDIGATKQETDQAYIGWEYERGIL